MKVKDIIENIVGDLPDFTQEELDDIRDQLEDYFTDTNNKLYLLLNNEKLYFTIVEAVDDKKAMAEHFLNFLLTDEYLNSLGSLQVVIPTSDGSAWEIWIGKQHFLFFECDSFSIGVNK